MSVHTADQGPAYRPDGRVPLAANVTTMRWLLVSLLVGGLVAIATVSAVVAWGAYGWIVCAGGIIGAAAIALILAEHLGHQRPGGLPGVALLARPAGRHRATGSLGIAAAVAGLLVVAGIVAAAILGGGAA